MTFGNWLNNNELLFALISFTFLFSLTLVIRNIEQKRRRRIKKLFTEDLPKAIHDKFMEKQRILGDEIFDEVFKYCYADESRHLHPSAVVTTDDQSFLISVFHIRTRGIKAGGQRQDTVAQVSINLNKNPPIYVTLFHHCDSTADLKPFGSNDEEKTALLEYLKAHITGCCLPK